MHTRLSIAGMAKWMTMATLAVAMLASSVTVSAQVNVREPDPSVWLRQIYDLYRRAETDKKAEAQANYRRVVERASKPLAALFKKNDDCEKKSKGICALDWDFVINGQVATLTNITVGPLVAKGNTGTVTVSFTNMGTPSVNVYTFVREAGQWKVDDIETKTGKDAPVRIAKLLKDYR